MALEPNFLSFRTISAGSSPLIGDDYGILQSAMRVLEGHRTGTHHHSFWQIEIILEGQCDVGIGGRVNTLNAGDYVLIPPGENHYFTYFDGPCKLITVKFTWKNSAPSLPKIAQFTPTTTTHHLAELCSIASRRPELTPSYAATLFGALLPIMPAASEAPAPSTFSDKIRQYIDSQQGKPITVDDIANHMNMSAKYVSTKFSRETDLTLKQSIDNHRHQFAEGLLRYEDDSISQIADIMGFKDVFSFSRFFYRMASERPKEYRKRHAQL